LNIEAANEIEAIEFVAADGHGIKQLKNVGEAKKSVSVKDLAAGLYSVVVTTTKGVSTHTIIKQ
jgi:hypothetical protein